MFNHYLVFLFSNLCQLINRNILGALPCLTSLSTLKYFYLVPLTCTILYILLYKLFTVVINLLDCFNWNRNKSCAPFSFFVSVSITFPVSLSKPISSYSEFLTDKQINCHGRIFLFINRSYYNSFPLYLEFLLAAIPFPNTS